MVRARCCENTLRNSFPTAVVKTLSLHRCSTGVLCKTVGVLRSAPRASES